MQEIPFERDLYILKKRPINTTHKNYQRVLSLRLMQEIPSEREYVHEARDVSK